MSPPPPPQPQPKLSAKSVLEAIDAYVPLFIPTFNFWWGRIEQKGPILVLFYCSTAMLNSITRDFNGIVGWCAEKTTCGGGMTRPTTTTTSRNSTSPNNSYQLLPHYPMSQCKSGRIWYLTLVWKKRARDPGNTEAGGK